MTDLSLPTMAYLHRGQRDLSTKSMELNSMMLLALGFSQTNFVMRVPWSGQNRVSETLAEATQSYIVEVIAQSSFSKQELIS
jgi:hypothetical protein